MPARWPRHQSAQVQSLAWGGSKPAHVIDDSLTFLAAWETLLKKVQRRFWITFGQASWDPSVDRVPIAASTMVYIPSGSETV
jgi:hypothetical protein